jgi:hypothetical protein
MHSLQKTAAALVFAGGAVGASGSADATPLHKAAIGATTDAGLIQQAQFVSGGRDYCFYPDGWRGPGFYWCGYRWRKGHGWGGGSGWHGWTPGAPEGQLRRGGEHNRVGRGPGENMENGAQGRSVSPGPQNGGVKGGPTQGGRGGEPGGTPGGKAGSAGSKPLAEPTQGEGGRH